MKKQKVILVGSNHAGTAAANILLTAKDSVELTIYERNWNTSFLGCGTALWVGNQISTDKGLFYSSKEELEKKGAKVHIEATVTNIDYDKKEVSVTLKDGKKIKDTYDKLILATGSKPIVPKFEGIELKNIQTAKLYQDAITAYEKNKDKKIKHVTVVGAGYIGVELAEAFRRNKKQVLLLDLADRCLSSHFDKEFSSLMQDRLDKAGIVSKYGEKVCGFEGKDGKVSVIKTDKGSYKTDFVVLCIGFKPNNELAGNKLELSVNGAIKTNKFQETSKKDVYAVGDCATVWNNAIDDVDYIALATNAVRSGIVAAFNVLGTKLESNGVQGSSGLCVYNLKMVSTGLSVECAQKRHNLDVLYTDYVATQKPAFMNEVGPNPEVRIRIVYRKDNRRVVGAELVSEYDMSGIIHMFSLAIQEKVTIDKLKLLDIFFMPHFNEPYNYITMAAISAK